MKCPYRVQVNKTFTVTDGVNPVREVRENIEYAECYGEDCPFWIDTGEYRDPFCGRAYNEVGGEL